MGKTVKKNKKNIEPKQLCNGISLSEEFYEKKENRLLTLLLKGFIVYLLTMGSIGFFLSTLDVEYNEILCHIVILIMAFVCAMLYYRLLVENTGYLIMIIVFAFLVFALKDYINSGFYAVVNKTVTNAAQYFDIDIQKQYTERIADRYLTVTLFALFAGIVLDILLNVYVSRRMQYVTAFGIVMFLNLIPLYMVLEPSVLYSGMILVGISMAVVFKSSKHYSPQVSTKRSNTVFKEVQLSKKKKLTELFYVYDVKALCQAGIITTILVMLIIFAVNIIWPKDSFNAGYDTNKYKKLTNAGFATFFVDGLEGFFTRSDDVGGLNSGELGRVSSIKLDHKTDLLVQLTPYDYNMVYLRSFVGQNYVPYENYWEGKPFDYKVAPTPEADALSKAYDNKEEYVAKGRMRIKVVDSFKQRNFSSSICLPYYYKDVNVLNRYAAYDGSISYEVDYFPRFSNTKAYVDNENTKKYDTYNDNDLYVPKENIDVIARFVSENIEGNNNKSEDKGNSGKKELTQEEKILAVKEYFSENIPYTVRPGKVPKNRDFVNYFLETGKKGYCSYFASSAVLIFRYMGIPARYVEGYAIDYFEIANAEIVEGEKYSDYYDGYSNLGETALVEINVTDADAHAWVEVYSEDTGWRIVDVTPASSDEEEMDDFWSMFADTMDSADETGIDYAEAQAKHWKLPKNVVRTIGYIMIGLFASTVLAFMAIKGRKYVKYVVVYARSNTNDKLIMKYSEICRKLRKKDAGFADRMNYRDQIEYLLEGCANKKVDLNYMKAQKETIIQILESAGFSNKEITEEELDNVIKWVKQAK